MKFTFGVCVGDINLVNIGTIFADIILGVPSSDVELIFIGGTRPRTALPHFARWIDFDETQKPNAWITRKKNIIAQEAKYENIVFMHDYFRLGNNWYDGWQSFGNDFQVACNCIMTQEGYRHSDWVIDPYLLWEIKPNLRGKFWDVALNYDETAYTKFQYISGGYFVAKKDFMLQHPFDEKLVWGDAEDIEWSSRVRKETTFKFNKYSYVEITKPNKWAPGLIPEEYLQEVAQHFGI